MKKEGTNELDDIVLPKVRLRQNLQLWLFYRKLKPAKSINFSVLDLS